MRAVSWGIYFPFLHFHGGKGLRLALARFALNWPMATMAFVFWRFACQRSMFRSVRWALLAIGVFAIIFGEPPFSVLCILAVGATVVWAPRKPEPPVAGERAKIQHWIKRLWRSPLKRVGKTAYSASFRQRRSFWGISLKRDAASVKKGHDEACLLLLIGFLGNAFSHTLGSYVRDGCRGRGGRNCRKHKVRT